MLPSGHRPRPDRLLHLRSAASRPAHRFAFRAPVPTPALGNVLRSAFRPLRSQGGNSEQASWVNGEEIRPTRQSRGATTADAILPRAARPKFGQLPANSGCAAAGPLEQPRARESQCPRSNPNPALQTKPPAAESSSPTQIPAASGKFRLHRHQPPYTPRRGRLFHPSSFSLLQTPGCGFFRIIPPRPRKYEPTACTLLVSVPPCLRGGPRSEFQLPSSTLPWGKPDELAYLRRGVARRRNIASPSPSAYSIASYERLVRILKTPDCATRAARRIP